MTTHNSIRVVLFDLGGVLVELSGVPAMLGWLGNRVLPEELWRMWLTSPAVRAFETGEITPGVFADRVIAEMQLPVTSDKFLDAFTRWPRGLFDGALDLLAALPPRYTRATLSNSNVLHWPRMMQEMALADAFNHHFASHLTGKIKPDDHAYRHVLDTLRCVAEEVLFLDDNELNVAAAKRMGINGVVVRGITETKQALVKAGLIAREVTSHAKTLTSL
jgi:putative hydrolase of the HAD superfamily